MQLFYITNIVGDTAVMNPAESRHCIRVLRMRKGDNVRFVDGSGGYYEGVISGDDPGEARVTIYKRRMDFPKHPYRLHIGIAPTKNIDRFEWFMEKATEIGIDSVTPLLCARSERKRIRNDRLEAILVSAMKQSVKAWKPQLNEMITLQEFLQGDFSGIDCFVAHCLDERKREDLIRSETSGHDYVVLIGPEGDFTQEEIAQTLKGGFRPVSLGSSRLRTETAGVVAAQIIRDKVSLED